jgi:hypothetical protein
MKKMAENGVVVAGRNDKVGSGEKRQKSEKGA